MVGSLARLNLNKENLHENTKRDAAKYLERFPSENVYDNNLAQAIEILHSIDHSIEIFENNKFQKEEPAKPEKLTGKNAGAIEAPRGTLYYALEIEEGKVKESEIGHSNGAEPREYEKRCRTNRLWTLRDGNWERRAREKNNL